MESYQNWKHVFKLDPNKDISDKDLEAICESGTDAVIVGGTDGVTLDNTLGLLSRIRQHVVDCALEITDLDAVTPGFDYYMIPTVLNAANTDWVVGKHHEAIKAFGNTINWDEVLMEGYCVLNPDSKVACLTESITALEPEDVEAYALMAEKMYRFPIFYIEYSGVYGDVGIVKQAKKALTSETQLFYGGGITNSAQAKEMEEYADTVVVGNIIYEDIKEALKTVRAVKENV